MITIKCYYSLSVIKVGAVYNSSMMIFSPFDDAFMMNMMFLSWVLILIFLMGY